MGNPSSQLIQNNALAMMKSQTKKTLFALLMMGCFALSVETMARPITPQQARQNVLSFMKDLGKSVSMSSLHHAALRAATQAEPYYVFNIGDNQGYVIASGDDCVPSILGYADNGAIDVYSIPCNLQAWLDGYASQIQYLRDHNISSFRSSKKTTNRPPIAPLLTSHWNQRYPYNMYCPIDPTTGVQCPTGCVATAMAQLMYYYRIRSVNQTTSDIPAYTTIDSLVSVDAIPAGSFIDWENMIDEYGYGENVLEEQKQAVANLMKYCGAALEMSYSSSGSGAASSQVAYSLIRYFNYNPFTQYISARGYTDEEWESIIYNELSNSRPVEYSVERPDYLLYHSVVCDGYDGNGYFHINFGWGGDSDGNYLIINPEGSPGYAENCMVRGWATINAEPLPIPQTDDQGCGIHFNDLNTKALCLWLADSNGDGILTENEAADVIETDKFYFKNSPITSFDELKYFTGLTYIGDNAFYGCDKLKSITIPKSVTSISYYSAFYGCNNLTDLTWNAKNCGSFLWPNSVERLSFGNEVETIPYQFAIRSDKLTSVIIPNSVTDIGAQAFYGCKNLTNVYIGSGAMSIASSAFNECENLTDLTWNAKRCISYRCPKSVERLFFGNEIEEIPFHFAQECTNLKSVTIPNTVRTIGAGAFFGCSGLTSVAIPKSVNSIGSYAFFNYDNGLSSVICLSSNPPIIDNSVFRNSYETATLVVPIEAIEAYQSDFLWSQFSNIVGIDSSLGDVNMDGEVNIADINSIINIILAGDGGCLNEFMSDVNCDGEVNIADINSIINFILTN